jgi:hypothetical protein
MLIVEELVPVLSYELAALLNVCQRKGLIGNAENLGEARRLRQRTASGASAQRDSRRFLKHRGGRGGVRRAREAPGAGQ